MRQFIKNTIRILIPAMIAIATLALPVLPALFGDLSGNLDVAFAQVDGTDTPTPSPSPTEETPTLTPDATPASTNTPTPTATLQSAEIEPDAITIYQELDFWKGISWIRSLDRGNTTTSRPAVETPTPTYSPPLLSIYVNQTHAPQVNIYHPPLNYQDGAIGIGVTQIPTCSLLIFSTAQAMDVNCYSIVVPAGTLAPGEYSAKLFVDVADQLPQKVDITLKVRANSLWIFITVACGVLATEFLMRWNSRWRYSIAWNVRRVEWFDLLSEELEWIFEQEYSNDTVVLNTILQLAKTEIREQTNALRGWLKKGRDGEVKLEDIPIGESQVIEILLPFKNAIGDYISNPTNFFGQDTIGGLEGGLNELRDVIKTHSGDRLKECISQVDTLYKKFLDLFSEGDDAASYQTLKQLYTSGRLTDDTLKTALKKIEAIKKNGTSLKDIFENSLKAQPIAELPQMAEVCNKLADNISKFKNEVIDVVTEQQSKIDAVTTTPMPDGKQLTGSLLQKLSELAPLREKAELEAKMANEPLCFPEQNINHTVQKIETLLNNIDSKLDQLVPDNIAADARANLILKPIREHLYWAEKNMANVQDESTLEATWRELSNHYKQDREFFRLGKRILKLWKNKYCDPAYLKNAYRYILEGKVLEAEVELERAEHYKMKTLDALKSESATKAPVYPLRETEIMSGVEIHEIKKGTVKRMVNTVPSPIDRMKKRPWLVLTWVLLLIVVFTNQLRDFGIMPLISASRLPFIPQWVIVLAATLLIFLTLLFTTTSSQRTVITNQLQRAGRWLEKWWIGGAEKGENFIPSLERVLTTVLSQLLTIFVAVALVIVTYQIADRADTWGKPFDFLSAFVWGVVANRVAEPAKSGWQKLVEDLAKPKKPAQAGTESVTEEKPTKEE